MYVRPISTRLLSGMLTPAIRAKSVYPCRCLCRGFWQITSTRPCRRMILHFSHIGLTAGRPFMIPFGRCSRRGGSGGRSGHRYHAPGAHAARGHLAVPSATKQNTKRLRHVTKGVWAALSALLVAPLAAAQPPARVEPPASPRYPG